MYIRTISFDFMSLAVVYPKSRWFARMDIYIVCGRAKCTAHGGYTTLPLTIRDNSQIE